MTAILNTSKNSITASYTLSGTTFPVRIPPGKHTMPDGAVLNASSPYIFVNVTEYATLADFPAIGVTGFTYYDISSGRFYKWVAPRYIDSSITSTNTQAVPVAKVAAVTLTAAELLVGLITYTGAAANLTMPLGTALDALGLAQDSYLDFHVSTLAGSAGAATIVTNTGITFTGSGAVPIGGSRFRLVNRGISTYDLYRI
jgi:hypothetical protein